MYYEQILGHHAVCDISRGAPIGEPAGGKHNHLQGREDFLRAFMPGRFAVVFLDILPRDGKEKGIEVARHIREADEKQLIVHDDGKRLCAGRLFRADAGLSCKAI